MEYGFQVVIAPSFADIFYGNCTKNGLLPVTLAHDAVDALFDRVKNAPDTMITVDLANGTVTLPDGAQHAFEMDERTRQRFLKGLDDIGLTLEMVDAISAFEARHLERFPWLKRGFDEGVQP